MFWYQILTNHFTLLANGPKTSPKAETEPLLDENGTEIPQVETGEAEDSSNKTEGNMSSASAFLSSAWNKVGTFTNRSKDQEPDGIVEEGEPQEPEVEGSKAKQANFLSNFSNMMGKVANNATTVIKDKVMTNSMIGEFNKQQEDFIKNKGNMSCK